MKKPITRKPNILISNDDGIDSPGIAALAHELRKIGNVTVVAPDKQRSAVGHAITVNYPLRAMKFMKGKEFFGYAVDGYPADCVKLAVRSLLPQKPDIVVSGVNHGSNTAINIIYSGTVSAATEGTVLGIPSIAISLATYATPDFRFAAKFGRKLVTFVLQKGLPQTTLLNVNVPAVPEKQIKGVVLTRQGKTRWDDTFDVRVDPANKEYYWLKGTLEIIERSEDTDEIAVSNKYISITPIHYNLTDHVLLEELKQIKMEELLGKA